MADIVRRMATLKSPWNCPHGRPSLISLGTFHQIQKEMVATKPVYKFWFGYLLHLYYFYDLYDLVLLG
jgi:hypothetical protein